MTKIILKNPYFEEEIKVKESYKHITETMITIHPKHFAKIEFYEEEDKWYQNFEYDCLTQMLKEC